MTNETKQTSTNPITEPTKPIVKPAAIVKRGGIGFFTATLMSVLAGLGGAYLALFAAANPQILTRFGIAKFVPLPAQNTAEIGLLRSEITQIRNRLAQMPVNPAAQSAHTTTSPTIPTMPSVPQTGGFDLSPLRGEIAGLSGRLTAIETRLAALDPTGTGGAIIASLQAEIATLKVTTADLQTKISQTPSPAITFAVISLAEAANRNGAFVPEFASVRAALPFLPEVAALEPYSRSGAPTRALIAERFNQLAAIFTSRAAQAKKEGGFLGWFKGLFSGLIKVENKDDLNGPNAVLARAKIKMDNGDLQGAIDDVRSIASPPNEVVTWINDAQRRLDLEVKIAALRGAIERGMTVQPANQNLNIQQQVPTATNPQIEVPAAKVGDAK
jgi:hypothetical protein